MKEIKLPAIKQNSSLIISDLTNALNISRNILASDDEIDYAWGNLPKLLSKILPELRTERIAKMCIAISTGLFDSAINYIWNESIIELRNKIRRFGLNVVQQIDSNGFDEKNLLDLKDAELLTLCHKLNLISEEGFFFLDQCRDIRNNFSSAHPTTGALDENELINFINRCAKYALSSTDNPIGVDIHSFINAIKTSKFNDEQKNKWIERLGQTHEAQLELLIDMLHGIFCDPSTSQETRLNSFYILKELINKFTPKIKSELINRHSDYIAKGDEKRHNASQNLFTRLKLLDILSDSEKHSIISKACNRLLSVHQGTDNFYNEPPFAENLYLLSKQGEVPDTVKNEFVDAVITCGVGNRYGISNAALPYYERIVKNFSPREIELMMGIIGSKTIAGIRIKDYKKCSTSFGNLVKLLDSDSIPVKIKKRYEDWLK